MPEGVQQKLKSNQKLNTIYRNKKDRLGIGFKVTADRNTEARAAKLPVQVFENSSDRNGGGIGTHGSIEIGPHTEIVLEASKSLTGRKWKDNDHFEVKLSAEDGAPMPRNYDGDAVETVSFRSDSDSGITEKVQFPEIAYTQPGIYRYSLKAAPYPLIQR